MQKGRSVRRWLSIAHEFCFDRPNRPRKSPSRRRGYRPALELLEDRLTPSTYAVDNNLDDGSAGSLRSAILQANANPGADTITFAPSLAGSTITLGGTQLELSDDVTITGLGADKVTIDGNQQSRVFQVDAHVVATISGLKITNGKSTGANYGGAIFNYHGTLTLANSAVNGSVALIGGGIENEGTLTVTNSTLGSNSAGSYGGAIHNTGTLTVTNTRIGGNSAGYYGGGVWNGGALTVVRATIVGNHAGYTGGGIFNFTGGRLNVANSVISFNSASWGGGIGNDDTVTVTRTMFEGNVSGLDGGAITNSGGMTLTETTFSNNIAHRSSGAIDNDGRLVAINSTFVGNTATGIGGAIGNWGDLTLTNSTIVGNRADSDGDGVGGGGGLDEAQTALGATLNNTIVAGNFKGTGTTASDIEAANMPVGGSNDLIGDVASAGNFSDTLKGVDATNIFVDVNHDGAIDSRDLAQYSQTTATLTLTADSPAINEGDNSLAVDASGNRLTTDQRGTPFARVSGGHVDIGAYERQSVDLVVSTTGDVVDSDHSPGHLSLREAVHLANLNPGADTITYAPNLAGSTITLGGTQLKLSDDVTITGLGADKVTIDANGKSRVLKIAPGVTASVSGLTITGGDVAADTSAPDARNYGGGIFNDEGTLVVSNCTIAGNFANQGNGIENDGTLTVADSTVANNGELGFGAYGEALGGGIYNTGTLTVDSTEVSDNMAIEGGGIYNGGTLTVVDSNVSGNVGARYGGGILGIGGKTMTVTVTNTTFDSNTSAQGGAILFDPFYANSPLTSPLTVKDSTFKNNHGSAIHFSVEGNAPGSTITDCTFADNHGRSGGAIIQLTGTLSVTNSSFTGNKVGSGGVGGAIQQNGGTLTVTNSSFSGNTAASDADGAYGWGGAIWSNGALSIRESQFTSNSAGSGSSYGGAIWNDSTATLRGVTLNNNSAYSGGGFFNAGTLDMVNCTLYSNSARAEGGGIANGAYFSDHGVLTVSNSTINGNSAYGGGGISGFGDSVSLGNTIVAGNTLTSSRTDADLYGNFTSVGHNLIGIGNGSSGFSDGSNGDMVGTAANPIDPMLGPLGNYGGSTETLPLLPGSPAINAGDPNFDPNSFNPPLNYDQRGTGYPRVIGGRIDIGAYEEQSLIVTNTNDSGPGSLRAAIAYANSHAGPDTISFNIPTTDPNFVDDDSTLSGGDAAPDVFVIHLLSALPALTDSGTTIDGRTQTAFTGDTNPFGPEIELDGSGTTIPVGLVLGGSSDTVRGLAVDNFDTAIQLAGGSHHTLAGDYIGVDPTGTKAQTKQSFGVVAFSSHNVVGGPTAADRNLIAGSQYQIWIDAHTESANRVEGNYIGLNAAGTSGLGVFGDGILIQDSPDNNITNNVISSQSRAIRIDGSGSTDNVVRGNFIGTNAAGTAKVANLATDVEIGGGTSNVIGGTGSGDRNILSGNNHTGVWLFGAGTSENVVQGNYIGTNVDGTTALANGDQGILISAGAHDNLIGGSVADAGNVISGNAGDGVQIVDSGTTYNTVAGNYIGTDAAGTAALGNIGWGVEIAGGARDNTIGGAAATAGNVISSNGQTNKFTGGIRIAGSGTSGNLVAGNLIGTDKSGTVPLGNKSTNVVIAGAASDNTLRSNVISASVANGVEIHGVGTTSNTLAGNLIGTDKSGTAGLGNGYSGVDIWGGATNNVIGGTTPADRNIISSNSWNGVEMLHSGTSGNIVEGNYIGTDITGTTALGNHQNGVYIHSGAHDNIIGTNGDGVGDAAEGNVISGNGRTGVFITGAGTNENVVAGNDIGTNAAGDAAIPNASPTGGLGGVWINGQAAFNRVGTNSDGVSDDLERNVISGNQRYVGLMLANAHDNVVAGNFIGTAADGVTALGNAGNGMEIKAGSQHNRIGTNGDGVNDSAERNIIAGNGGSGIMIWNNWQTGTAFNVVAGNYIGLASDGKTAVGNRYSGILVTGGVTNNRIGSDGSNDPYNADERNLISGNGGDGVSITGSGTDSNIVAGNYIGTDVTGTAALGNGGSGIAVASPNNVIGKPGAGNVVSGNAGDGMYLSSSATGNLIEANYVGTNAAGNAALANGADGIGVHGPNNTIGGTTSDAGNLISGNAWAGVALDGSNGDIVAGNLIGTDAAGTNAIPNSPASWRPGIFLNGSDNLIGGTTAAARNIISGNRHDGIMIDGNETGNSIEGNFIGTDMTGLTALGNGGDGVFAVGGAYDNIIGTNGDGDGDAAEGNLIAFNSSAGVGIQDDTSTGNSIRGNSIHDNGGLGIDLSDDGVTANDAGDGDAGPNNLQNFPVISLAESGTTTRAVGTLNSTPNTTFIIDFYASDTADPSGHGEARIWLGFISVTTDDSGNALFDTSSLGSTTAGQILTATATGPDGSTSEFALNALVMQPTAGSTDTLISNTVTNYASSGTLTQSEAGALNDSLVAAQNAIESGHTTAAAGEIGAFVNKIDALILSDRLDQEDADLLLEMAGLMLAQLNA